MKSMASRRTQVSSVNPLYRTRKGPAPGFREDTGFSGPENWDVKDAAAHPCVPTLPTVFAGSTNSALLHSRGGGRFKLGSEGALLPLRSRGEEGGPAREPQPRKRRTALGGAEGAGGALGGAEATRRGR